MNSLKQIYWIATISLISIMILAGIWYLVCYVDLVVYFKSYGYPTYLIYPLAFAKIIGSIVILYNKEFLVEFAKIGLGISAVIKEFVSDELKQENLYEWETNPKLPKRSIGLLYRKGEALSIASKTFINFMVNESQGTGLIDSK